MATSTITKSTFYLMFGYERHGGNDAFLLSTLNENINVRADLSKIQTEAAEKINKN